jgi:two-component system response regulator ChvI
MAKITLVDDDENIVASVSLALESHGHTVKAYYDGLSGLQALESDPPDLAILDVKMPRMDGMEVLKRLRQNHETPVIILTSKDDEIDEILGFNLGADDYIHKPFSQRLLLERVKAVLRRAGAGDDPEGQPAGAPGSKAIKRGRLTLDPARHDCLWDGKPVKLTVTEFLLLQSLAQRPGFVKSRDNLMDAASDDPV